MQLPHSESRQKYIDQIKVVEANLKDATSGEKNKPLLALVQKRLDFLAEKYQFSEEIGTARYKLYELQALVHYFNGHDDDALDFINQAIEMRDMPEARKTEQAGSQALSIASLVLGILAIITCLVWYIGIVFGILAIIFGAVSVKRRGRRKAIAGIVTGSVGVVLSLLIVWIVQAALPSLQQSQRDTARKNDVSVLTTDATSFMTENRGQLPGVSDLSTSSLVQVTSVSGEGEPTTEMVVFKTGTNCDGVSSTRDYAFTVLLENGSEYCLGS